MKALYKKLFSCVIASSLLLSSGTALAAQTREELDGKAVTYFSEDFESYETEVYTDKSVRSAMRYPKDSRVMNGAGNTVSETTYTANAAENIPVFNGKVIENEITVGESVLKRHLAVYNPDAQSLTVNVETDGENTIYTAEGPQGNVVYGGLPGFYGWSGVRLFPNFPSPIASSQFAMDLGWIGDKEQRLAVVDEVYGDKSSNKLLIMDAPYCKKDGNIYSQAAVFGKHNLDFSGNTSVSFRMYPYRTASAHGGFRMYLTRGEYNLEYKPAFYHSDTTASGTARSAEYHSESRYTGEYFPEEDKYPLLYFHHNPITAAKEEGATVPEERMAYAFSILGGGVWDEGFKYVSRENSPPTYTHAFGGGNGLDTVIENNEADLYYDITIDIERYSSDDTRFFLEIKDNHGEVFYTTSPNGIGWDAALTYSDDAESLEAFLNTAEADGEKLGIVFEATSGLYSGNAGRTKVGIDNLKFSKKDFSVRNAWIFSENGSSESTLYYEIYNYTKDSADACLIAAVYDKDTMQLVDIVKTSSSVTDDTALQEGSFKLPDVYSHDTHTARLFVWRENALSPMNGAVEIYELF